MFTDLEIAQQRANSRFNIGEKQENNLIDHIASMTIRDKLVAPKSMEFRTQGHEGKTTGLSLTYGDDPTHYTIHRHALGQLASKVGLPLKYLNDLSTGEDWRWDLLLTNLNTLFHRTKFGREEHPRFLHRLVGTELRGFLSRKFNRHLASLPLLRGFVEAVHEHQGKPVETTTTALRWSLKCFLPMVFEAFPGQYLCIGVTQSHSDFGAGKHVISRTIWDPIRDTRTVLEGIGKVHLGSVIEDADIEMSEGTAVSEVETQVKAAQDTVKAYLSEESVEKALKVVRIANEESIPWPQLEKELGRLLEKSEIESVKMCLERPDVMDLPPIGKTASGDPLPTKWWAASIISKFANNVNDEKKFELQNMAGKWLGE